MSSVFDGLTSSFGLDPGIEAQLRKMGPNLNGSIVERTRELFVDRKDFSLPADAACYQDVAYGSHARQMLDICQPGGEGKKPVALFVPGGGFAGGDKSFYFHLPHFFARRGYIGVTMNYRLTPEFTWPSGAQDVSTALDWIAANAERFGADSTRMIVVGESAGACHVATVLFDQRFSPQCQSSVRVGILMSGLYLIHDNGLSPSARLYFGEDTAAYPDRSSVLKVACSRASVIITIAELDPPFFASQAAALLDALAKRDGRCTPIVWLRGHNHVSPVLGMGGREDRLGDALLAQLGAVGQPRALNHNSLAF